MAPPLQPGALFAGDYRVLEPLSAGGMGAVYVAEQLSTRKLRALKLMHGRLLTDEPSRRRFELEARIGAQIPSEHVVEVQAAGVDAQSGLPYLVMELLEGEPLESTIQRRGWLAPAEVRVVMEQVCHAVGAAHRAGIVHRDLKPLNVFLARARRTDATYVVKVLDFGIAKLVSEGATQTSGIGSPLWLAPEQADRGQIGPGADVWALGLIAFYLLTGASFWPSAAAADSSLARVMKEVLFDPIPLASARAEALGRSLPPGFDAWFAACVVREPARRFADAHHAFAALAPLLPPGGALGPELGAPLGAAAEIRVAYESGRFSTSFTSGTLATTGGATSGTPSAASFARGGIALGCLAAAVLVPALALALGLGGVWLLQRNRPSPRAEASEPGTASGAVNTAAEATAGTDPPLVPGEPAPAPGLAPMAYPAGRDATETAPPSDTSPKAGATSAPAAGAATTPAAGATTPAAGATSPAGGAKPSGEKPSSEVAWAIAHAVAATDIKSCLYSKITRPGHGTFAIHHSVTVRFDGTRLLGTSVTGTSMYPAADLKNADYKPATQAEVDAELARVLGCIRGKVGGVAIPANSARGAVSSKFSGSDLYDAWPL